MLSIRRSASRRPASRPPSAGRVVALALAALLVFSAATAGRTYLWCVVMERAMSACCTDGAEDAELAPGQDASPEISRPCCERHRTGEPAKARAPSSPLEVPPPVATLAPAAPPIERPVVRASLVQASRPALRSHRSIRAGPHAASDTCVRLQVFRC